MEYHAKNIIIAYRFFGLCPCHRKGRERSCARRNPCRLYRVCLVRPAWTSSVFMVVRLSSLGPVTAYPKVRFSCVSSVLPGVRQDISLNLASRGSFHIRFVAHTSRYNVACRLRAEWLRDYSYTPSKGDKLISSPRHSARFWSPNSPAFSGYWDLFPRG